MFAWAFTSKFCKNDFERGVFTNCHLLVNLFSALAQIFTLSFSFVFKINISLPSNCRSLEFRERKNPKFLEFSFVGKKEGRDGVKSPFRKKEAYGTLVGPSFQRMPMNSPRTWDNPIIATSGKVMKLT